MNDFKFSENDKKIMRLAIKLAGKASGLTSPNPLVGAVIIKNGNVIASGYHKRAGLPHAEIEAINSLFDTEVLRDAMLYVTLEPCDVYGKTPPCTDAIIKHRFSEVIIGSIDPNPKISGSGISKLKNAGIKVKYGLLEEQIKQQNEIFFKHIVAKSPFITLKTASSIDGKIATKTGDSRWITSVRSRRLVHKIRKQHDCILTGINTVIADDPLLYPRKNNGTDQDLNEDKKYYRVVLDSNLRMNAFSNIAKTANKVKTVIFTSGQAFQYKNRLKELKDLNIDIIKIPVEKNDGLHTGNNRTGIVKLDILKALKILYDNYGITSIIVEAGPNLSTEFLRKGLVDKFLFFISPKILGGNSNYSMFSDLGILKVSSSIELCIKSKKSIGDDILITAYPKKIIKE
jgi:diaminohydroxyphosphoribosylaminopyrimidine deaminase/5-amino-6-(5-phosphoribosylamino)uracil reductase